MRISVGNNSAWLRLAGKIVFLVIAIWVIFGILFGLHRIDGVAMTPSIKDGDLAFFIRNNSSYTEDDVVIYRHDEKSYVSKILAVSGELIEIDEEGYLYVDGQKALDSVVYNIAQGDEPQISMPYRVPIDSYFMLNENLDSLEDSRSFGAISAKSIQGKIIGILRTREI